ncbi:hypothetical protein [Paraburkholderia humisilvae]|uniref:Pilin accessory protein (PilO) n=1 Tax=Paraburkholderia humisilvae TaxID=627669 RepID=A0A6J5EM00_9BURK|nr:hypothetical protein [Paraburkholderia humisilvae]CAB3767558.1 hypothetical protein LMG29542_05649 [Paraburkholderia humisilvae]
MIIDVNGKKIAFGLSWKSLVGGGNPESMAVARARTDKSALIWTDAESFQVGLLPAGDLTEKEASSLSEPIYAAARILGRIKGLKKNVLMALTHPGSARTFILVGIHKGKPKDRFDLVDISGEVLSQKIAEYRELLRNEPFDLIGDIRALDGIYPTPIDLFAENVDEYSALHRPKSQVPVRKVGIAVAIVLGCFLIAKVGGPVAMKKWREHHQRQMPDPQKLYDDAINEVRTNAVLPATELAPWYGWFRSLPWDIGGWNLSAVSCSFTPSGAMFCALDYKRALVQATYKTFMAALPTQWAHSYRLDQDVVHIQTQSPIGRVSRVAQFLDSAPTANDVTYNFQSQLQSYQVTGKYTLSPFTLFGADGIDPSALRNTYRAAAWSMDGPMRNFQLLAKFPPYAIVSGINVQVQSDPQSSIDNSMFKATVKGQVLVKG